MRNWEPFTGLIKLTLLVPTVRLIKTLQHFKLKGGLKACLHMRFLMRFLSRSPMQLLAQVLTSGDFLCDSGATFALICCDFPKHAAKLHQVATNRSQIALKSPLVYTTIWRCKLRAKKIVLKSATKIAQKFACVSGPLGKSARRDSISTKMTGVCRAF